MAHRSALLLAALFAVSPLASAKAKPGTLVVLNKAEATASLINNETGVTIKKLPVGVGPHEAAASPNGKLVAVANYGDQQTVGRSLTILDLTKSSVLKTIDMGEFDRPHGIDWLDNDRIITTSERTGHIVTVNVSTGKVEMTIPTNAKISHMLALSPDKKRVYTANIGSGSMSAFDLKTGARAGEVATGAGAEGINVTRNNKQVWVTNAKAGSVSVVDADSMKVLDTMQAGKMPIRVWFSLDGKTAIVTCAESGEIVFFDVATRKERSRLSLNSLSPKLEFGQAPGPMPVGILGHPSEDTIYVAAMGANRICVLDLSSRKIVKRFETGPVPDGMAFSSVLAGK
jgi:YVTN family beta-propeller protein